uniref:Taraxerol synthase n=1 Tax=Rhizophora mucronata TaxID=61149 RepID=A0A2P2MRY9_RHIMU
MSRFAPFNLMKRLSVKFFSQLLNQRCNWAHEPSPIQVGHWHVNDPTIAPHFCYVKTNKTKQNKFIICKFEPFFHIQY